MKQVLPGGYIHTYLTQVLPRWVDDEQLVCLQKTDQFLPWLKKKKKETENIVQAQRYDEILLFIFVLDRAYHFLPRLFIDYIKYRPL